jgi:DNA-binding NarL/FixJ family response regulator
MIRLLIVDDHQLMRDGLVRLIGLEPEIELVGTGNDGTEAVRLVAELKPDVVLMDIRMPEMSGIAATREIKKTHPDVKVVLLTMHDEDDYVFEGISAGACGYLLKDTSRDDLISSIKGVHAGQVEMTPSVTRKVVQQFATLHQGGPGRRGDGAMGRRGDGATVTVPVGKAVKYPVGSRPEDLSRREMDVLRLVVRGCSNRQIAEQLFIDETTVKTHLHRIFDKLNVRDRTQAAVFAMQHGLCPASANGAASPAPRV